VTWGERYEGLRGLWRAVFYLVMTVVFVLSISMGATAWVCRDRPVYGGTFTAASASCSARGLCTSVGRWVSADGAIIKEGVRLDGAPGAGGHVRASYQTGGPMGDDVNNIVHTATASAIGPWVPWMLAPLCRMVGGYARPVVPRGGRLRSPDSAAASVFDPAGERTASRM
jgi:hypothetical protein